jgi:hypothetical protein
MASYAPPKAVDGRAQDPIGNWLGNSVWQVPQLEISKAQSWASITAMSFHRGAGEGMWRSDRHRVLLAPDHLPPRLLQVEQGPTWQLPAAPPGSVTFVPPAS